MADERTKQFNTLAEEYFQCLLALKEAKKDYASANQRVTSNEADLATLKKKLGEFIGQNLNSRAANLKDAILTIDYGNNNAHSIKVYNSEGELFRF